MTTTIPAPGFYWARFPDSDGWSILEVDENHLIWDFGDETALDPLTITWGPAIPQPAILKD